MAEGEVKVDEPIVSEQALESLKITEVEKDLYNIEFWKNLIYLRQKN